MYDDEDFDQIQTAEFREAFNEFDKVSSGDSKKCNGKCRQNKIRDLFKVKLYTIRSETK